MLKSFDEKEFDNRELWSLDMTIAKFVLPRLKAFQEVGTKNSIKPKIEKMIKAFELVIALNCIPPDKKQRKIIRSGLFNFYKHFGCLWY